MENKIEILVNTAFSSDSKKAVFKEMIKRTLLLFDEYKSSFSSQENVSQDIMNDIRENFQNITVDCYIVQCARNDEEDEQEESHKKDEAVFRLIEELFS